MSMLQGLLFLACGLFCWGSVAATLERDVAPQFFLWPLPYSYEALQPFISAETMEYHHTKHVQAYVNKANELTANNSGYAGRTVEELLNVTDGSLFNQIGQIWNHRFFFQCMTPSNESKCREKSDQSGYADRLTCDDPSAVQNQELSPALKDALTLTFGSVEDFKKQFSALAASHFGSGWVWLVLDPLTGTLKINDTDNAHNPLTVGSGRPLLGIDVWEHAYYIDYRNKRVDHIQAWWNVVNWKFVGANYEAALKPS